MESERIESEQMVNSCVCTVLNYNDASRSLTTARKLSAYSCVNAAVIVDNKSTDDSAVYLREQCSKANDSVYFVEADCNGGYGSGNNLGIELASRFSDSECGETFVLIANPDTNISEESVRELIDCLANNPRCVACAPMQRNREGSLIGNTAWDIPSWISFSCQWGRLLSKAFTFKTYGPEVAGTGRIRVGCLSGALLMVRRDAFLSMGGYDENVFLYCEETMVGMRAQRNQLTTILCTDCSYDHIHSASISKQYKKQVDRYKLLLDSSYYVLAEYYGVTGIRMWISTLIGAAALQEICVAEAISHLKVKLTGRLSA